MHKSVVHVIACFFFCHACCLSQQYPVVRYTPKDGLVNSRVRSCFQDSRGRMYFLTNGGLSVYDGVRFKNFTAQNGLVSDFVNDIVEITPDSFLISTNTCGLNALVHGQMKTITLDSSACPVVNQFIPSPDGQLYASADDGLYLIQGSKFIKLNTAFPGGTEKVAYIGKVITYDQYLILSRNELLSFTGLFLFDKKKGEIVDAIPAIPISLFSQDRKGIVWAKSEKKIFILDTLSLHQGRLKLTTPDQGTIADEDQNAVSIIFNRENELILYSGAHGIIRYAPDGTRIPLNTIEIGQIAVQQIFIDRENIIWLCSDGNGIYKISNTSLRFDVPFPGINSSGIGLASNLSGDSLFMVMNNSQVILHTPASETVYQVKPDIKFDLIHHYNRDIYAAVKTTMFHANLPEDGTSVLHFKPVLIRPDTVTFSTISMLDPYGHALLADRMNVCVFDSDQLLYTFPINSQDLIEGILPASDHHVWLVFRSGNVMLCSLHPEQPDHYLKLESKFNKELEGGSPRAAAMDHQGLLWIGTRFHGLFAFQYISGQLIKQYHYQMQEGLTDNFITALAVDSNQNIIVGTQTGLDKLIKSNQGYRIENVTKRNAIFAFIRQLWVNTQNQVYAVTNFGRVFEIEPSEEKYTSFQPQLILEDILINGKPLEQIPSPLILTHDQNNITFGFAAPTFIDETQITYRYKLDGDGAGMWSQPTSSADFSFLNLSPGHYHLQVSANFPSTPYGDKTMSYRFQILPAWWQSTGYRFVAASLLSILLLLVVRQYFLGKLEKQKINADKQQAIEKERTRIATDMHDDLGAGLSRIRFLGETIDWKSKSGQSIGEDIDKIKTYSHEMIDKMGEIVWALNEKNDSLEDLLTYIRAYTVDYLEHNAIAHHVDMEVNIPTRFVSGEMRRNIFLTIKEALHNVVKHANATNVYLRVQISDELQITVRDDGSGFDPSRVRPYSNGLSNMRKRIAEINGQLEIQHGKGTSIQIRIPMNG